MLCRHTLTRPYHRIAQERCIGAVNCGGSGLLQWNGAAPIGIFMEEVTQRQAVSPAMTGDICVNTNKGAD